jgi:hypothetical protein
MDGAQPRPAYPRVTADELAADQYCQATMHRAHCSFVNLMEMSSDKSMLVTVGVADQAILIWRLGKLDAGRLELDHLEHDTKQQDVFFAEIDPRDKMNHTLLTISAARRALIDMRDKIDGSVKPEIFLRVHKVLGRKAFNRRNSLLVSKNNQLIFFVGTLIVFMTAPLPNVTLGKDYLEEYFKQSFVRADEGNSMSTSPEISCIAICSDRRFLCVGTLENNAKIIKWDALSCTKLNTIVLYGYTCIEFMKIAFDSHTLVCLALTERYFTSLLILDTAHSLIIAKADFEYSLPFKIKYVDFVPGSTVDLISCGVRHLAAWKVRGGLLKFEGLSLTGVSSSGNDDENAKDEDSNSSITFLSFVIVESFMLVAADNGNVSGDYTGLSVQRYETQENSACDAAGACGLSQLLPLLHCSGLSY